MKVRWPVGFSGWWGRWHRVTDATPGVVRTACGLTCYPVGHGFGYGLTTGLTTGPHCPSCFPTDTERAVGSAAPMAEAAPLPPGAASAAPPAVAA